MSTSIRLRSLAGTAALVAGLFVLAACGDDEVSASSKDATVKVDDDEITVKTSEGTATIGKDLPDGFPEGDVPLVDEEIVSAVANGQGSWSVVMSSTRAIDDLSAEIVEDFADAGFTAAESNELGDVSIHQFSDDRYRVGVTVTRTADTVTITYLVESAG
jgi:hypothetical protein